MARVPRRRSRKLRTRSAEEEERDFELWVEAHEQSLLWLLYSAEGQNMLVTLGNLSLCDSVTLLGMRPLDDDGATRDPHLEALFARLCDRALKRWGAPGHAFAAGAIGALAGLVWNYSHADQDTTASLLRDLVDVIPMPSDRGHVVFLGLMAGLLGGMEGEARPVSRFVSSVELLGCDHRGTRLAVKVTGAPLG